MANPNGLNPHFPATVSAAAFRTRDVNGSSITSRSTNGTTAVLLLGTVTSFAGTITGVFGIAEGGVSATISLSAGGVVIATLSQGATTGGFMGPSTPFTSTTFSVGSTVGIFSSSALTQGAAKVFITYDALNP